MKAEIYSHKNLIGTVDLLPGDISMGCVYGKLEPNKFYFNHIAPKVKAFWSTSKPDYKSWNALRFNAKLENGYYLFPLGYTMEENDNEIRIDIVGLDREGLNFITGERNDFLNESWETIPIERKIAFEDELHKELGNNNNNVLKFFKKEHIHKLSDTEFCAVGTDYCDNVLFSIRKQGSKDNFALVHLTWKGKQEIDNFPYTKLYQEFDDFKINILKEETECEN